MPSSTDNLLDALPDSQVPPKRRIKDAEAAQDLVSRMWDANENRRTMWAKYQGQRDGNPPYPPTKMRNRGEEWRANFNTLQAKSLCEAAKVPYYDLFSAVFNRVEVRLEDPVPQRAMDWSAVVNEELDVELKRHPAFDDAMQRLIEGFVAFGKGYLYWDHPVAWLPRMKRQDEVLFPDYTSTDPEDWEVFAVKVDYPLSQLWAMIRDEEAARRAGWNPAAVKNALMTALPRGQRDSLDAMEVQRQIRENDIYASTQAPVVQTAHLYVKEWDGKWTRGIVLFLQNPSTTGGQMPKPEWLYLREGYAEHVRHIIAPFYFSIGDGGVNSIEGLLHDIYTPSQMQDRLACSLFDNGFLRMTIPLQARTANAKAKASLVVVGGVTMLPPGFDVQQATIFGDMDSGLALSRETNMMLERNTGVYRPQLQAPSGNPRTAQEVSLNYSTAATLSNSSTGRFYNQLDWAYTEIYRRISSPQSGSGPYQKAANDFQKRCTDRQVPKESMRKVRWVRATRSVGQGNVVNRAQAYNAMVPLAGSMPESGRIPFLRDLTAANLDHNAARRYYPTDSPTPDHDTWDSTVENGQLKLGQMPLLTSTQNHATHLQVHMAAGAAAVAAVQQGAPLEEGFLFLQGMLPHANQHLALLAADPLQQDQVKQFTAGLKQLGQAAEEMLSVIQQQQQQAAEGQQMAQRAAAIQSGQDPEMQLKAAETQAKLQLSAAKTAEGMRQKEEKHQQAMRQMAEKGAMATMAAGQQMALKQKAAEQKPAKSSKE